MAWIGLFLILVGSFSAFLLSRRKGDRKRTDRDLYDPNPTPADRAGYYVIGMIFIVFGILLIVSTIE